MRKQSCQLSMLFHHVLGYSELHPCALCPCRHGQLSRAMRNRGIEIFIPPESPSSPLPDPTTAPSARPEAAEGTGIVDAAAHLEHSSALAVGGDLERMLAAEGVPGTALPRAMAAAHLAVARAAAEYHRWVGCCQEFPSNAVPGCLCRGVLQ